MARQWFIFKDGKQNGPLAPDELKRRAATGELQPEDHVRPDDRPNWYKASAVKGLLFPSNVSEGPPQTLPPHLPTVPVETGTPLKAVAAGVLAIIFGVVLLIVVSGLISKYQAASQAEKAAEFEKTAHENNEYEYRKRTREIEDMTHDWNKKYSETRKMMNPDFPTGEELDRMNEIGHKSNPTLNEIEEYKRIKARSR